MISFLHSLHAVAAERGEGLDPELCKRLPDMHADKINELNAAQSELQRRRSLALARQERADKRKTLLDTLIETERQADHLRAWIARQELQLEPEGTGELSRMLQWASGELAALETASEPMQLAEMLRMQDLFPQTDKLADPLGDPPPLRPWGR